MSEDMTQRESKEGVVREMEIDVIFSLQAALEFHKTLGENLNVIQATNIVKHETPSIPTIKNRGLAAGFPPNDAANRFNREITTTNTSDPVWQQVQVVAGSVTNGGGVAFPEKQSQSLVYDLDGNLAFDGIWSYAWDAENRLRSMWMTNIANIAHSNRLRLDFAYDYMGRRGGVRP